MRRKKLLIAIAALASLGPIQAQAADTATGDREIAQQIMKRLKSNRDSGALKDFALDMKVDQGVVLFRGNVNASDQKQMVLDAASGIEGIAKVVDEVSVNEVAAPVVEKTDAVVMTPKPATTETQAQPSGFSFSQALATEAQIVRQLNREPMKVAAGVVQPVAAMEETSNDQNIVSGVVSALGQAQKAGQLKGFGVDVQCNDGVVELTGRAASPEQRNTILSIAQRVSGVTGVRESIAVPTAAPSLKPLPEMTMLEDPQQQVQAQLASTPVHAPAPLMSPAPVMQQAPMQQAPMQQAPMMQQTPMMQQARMQHAPVMQAAPHRTQGQTQAMAAGFGGGGHAMQTPVPMAPHAPVGAPRYDSPNLPNYAWPGYAAHPNYAAVTYPQQYSPSAWPFIGPFYPYPQVPLGWRKVSLEWDDGWWFLDFTDR